ncbi:unnamed protein product [Discula destructiva]
MLFRNIATALAGLSLAAAAPAAVERDAAGILHWHAEHDTRDFIIQETVVENQVIVVNENLDALEALALQAEQEFAALVQAQLELVETVETIKDNIRLNHFKTRWNTVNIVIIVVTVVVDDRDPSNKNDRYMVKQLKADNNNPEQEILIFINAADSLTIQPAAAPPSNLTAPDVMGAGQVLSQPTNTPQVAQLDPTAAFAQAADGAMILPYNSTAPAPPSGAQLFSDPADIILPNQALFVGDVALIQQDAALQAAGSLFDLEAQLLAQEDIASVELAGVVLGSAPPPTVIVNAKRQLR